MYFLLICAFHFGGDVIFFPGWYISCVKFNPAVFSFFKNSLSCWTDWNRISFGLCKGSENICLFLMEIQETYRKQKGWRAYLPGGKHWKGRSPQQRNGQSMTDSCKILQKKQPTSAAFRRWIFLRLLDLWLPEFLYVEPQRAHMHWPFPQPPPGEAGWAATRTRAQRGERLVQVEVETQFYIFYCKCQSSHFLYSVLILYVK